MRAHVIGIALAMSVGGCSSSSDVDAKDGGPAEEAARDTRDSREDATADASDAGADADIVFPVFALDAGSSWTDLYRDYFGTTGVASCAGDGNCHGGASQHGFKVSGFLCPPGNKTACHAGITSPPDGGAGLITPGDTFHQDYISQVLRQEHDAGGGMPRSPPYTFTAVDIERISNWILAGAPNN